VTDSDIPIGDVLISGSGKIRQGLDLDMERGANESSSTQGEYEDLFQDIANTLVLENTFLGSILDSERYFYIPSYQRYYSWDTSNHEELWRTIEDAVVKLNDGIGEDDIDFESGTEDGRLNEFYFGTLYIAESGGPNSPGEDDEIYEVIDGQQRIATTFIILNEIRLRLERIINAVKEANRENEDFDDSYLNGLEYLRDGLLNNVLYKGGHNAGHSEYLRIKLHRHDREYFRTVFEDNPRTVVKMLYPLKQGEFPKWMSISNIMEKSGKDPEDIDFDLDDLGISVDDDDAEIEDILNENRYFATKGSHQKIFDAIDTYEGFIDELLDEKLGFDEDAYRGRAICLINTALLLLVSLRIVECKFQTPMDNSLKIDVFKSLNETGEPLDIKSKVRARIVSRFEVGSPQVEQFENIVETFGDNSDTVEDYLVDYILATEQDVVFDKRDVSGNLLRFFSLRGTPSGNIQSRLVENDDEDRKSPTKFIQDLETHAGKYNIIEGEKSIPAKHISNRTLRNECNNILDDLKGDQWKPFVLLMYMELMEGSAVVSEKFFRDMLRLVENIMMRNSFAASAATAIESTFIGACKAYNAQDIPDFDDIEPYSNVDKEWMETDEFGTETRKIMQAHLVGYSSWKQISGSNIVRNLHGPAWSNNKQVLKLLSRRYLADRIDRGGGAVERDQLIDFSDTQLEHIFPKQPRINADDGRAPDTVAAPLSGFAHFFQLNQDEEDESDEDAEGENGLQWPSIRAQYEELIDMGDDEDFDEEGYERLKAQAEPIVEDIGNQMLLEEPINDALRNRQFSLKSVGYYLLLKQDLVDFDEYIAELDKIPINDGEFIQLVECLGSKLGEGETRVLLHEVVNAFSHITLDEVNRHTVSVDLNDGSLFDPNEFETHYSTATELIEEFDLDKDEYSDLCENWADYEYDSTEGRLVGDDSDEYRGPDDLMDEMVEAVLLSLVGEFDETEVPDSPDSVCELRGDYIVDTINTRWNWEIVVDRKVDIVERLLEELKIPTLDSEFSGHDEDYHRKSIITEFKYT
jgi:hypothetical protein